MKKILLSLTLLALLSASVDSSAQTKLHVNPRWSECSLQLDPSLTQNAWHQFTQEAGLVAYFRPVSDAKPMGAGHFEVALLQWATAFDDKKAAWNDTFVHPDSTHWLKEGSQLKFPGLTARVGITKKLDAAVYFTKNPGANYGFWGGQLQYSLVNNLERKWAAAARTSFMSLYGPDDLNLKVYGLDLIASKDFRIYSDWIFISPYAGVSTYLSCSHEKTNKINLHDEKVGGGQAMVGTVFKISKARIGAEYNIAKVNTLSFKIGVGF